MGDVIDIKPVRLEEKQGFISDCCRYQEGILSEANMKRKYGFADNVWERLGDDTALLEAVEDEKIRRLRNGSTKREKSQLLVLKAPDVAASIMNSTDSNDRHRLDACKVLNDFAADPMANTPAAASDRFVITINLNGDVEHYDKSITINPDDSAAPDKAINHKRPSGSQLDLFTTTTPDKPWDSGSGEPV